MRLLPLAYISRVERIGLDPVLCNRGVQIDPLGHDPGILPELVGLEPVIDLGADGLILIGTTGKADKLGQPAQLLRDAVA